ncbi:hypothetical protein U9M48_012383, partial [Paspalum notatum var. saurae]
MTGQCPCDLAPSLYEISKRKQHTLHEALQNKNWISFSVRHLLEYVQLWRATQSLVLHTNTEDTATWKFTPTGEYSSQSAYKAQFIGSIKTNLKDLIWKTWALPKCKFFGWLAIQNRIWTADRLQEFTKRLWKELSSWTANLELDPTNWEPSADLHQRWTNTAAVPSVSKKGYARKSGRKETAEFSTAPKLLSIEFSAKSKMRLAYGVLREPKGLRVY